MSNTNTGCKQTVITYFQRISKCKRYSEEKQYTFKVHMRYDDIKINNGVEHSKKQKKN